MNHVRHCLLVACSSASIGSTSIRAAEIDPSDVTRSSYATPVRGDVIEWDVHRDASVEGVTFEPGSSVLGMSARAALDRAVARSGREGRAEVTGRTDPDGRAALGVARALSLRRALIAAGLPPSHVAIVGEDHRPEPDATRYRDSTVRFLGIAPGTPRRPGAVAVAVPASAVSPPIAAAVPTDPAVSVWEVQPQDITLARTLERWAMAAGYKVRWDADRNFLVAATDRYEGSFEAALQALLGSAGIRHSDYPLEACIYANRPPLVRITRLGEQARECEAP